MAVSSKATDGLAKDIGKSIYSTVDKAKKFCVLR